MQHRIAILCSVAHGKCSRFMNSNGRLMTFIGQNFILCKNILSIKHPLTYRYNTAECYRTHKCIPFWCYRSPLWTWSAETEYSYLWLSANLSEEEFCQNRMYFVCWLCIVLVWNEFFAYKAKRECESKWTFVRLLLTRNLLTDNWQQNQHYFSSIVMKV